MATYIQGITDYIPKIQPFKPDFNFYQAALQTKQQQYNAGYNKVSALYGELLNSELLREPNKERRTQFFQDIDNEIHRLSGVDLSLPENIDQASKVFQPLIDNEYFRRDLSYTKQYFAGKSKGQALKNNPNKDSDERWWEEGDRAMDYQARDFANSSDDESLQFSNPSYTPFINTTEKLFAFAKEYDINPVTPSREGVFMVKTTNGTQAIPVLQNIFSSVLTSDPRIKNMFTTQAYVNRKDYMITNADKFGGDEYAAETQYLQEKYNEVTQFYQDRNPKDQQTSDRINTEKKVLEERIQKNGGVDPDLDPDLVAMYQGVQTDKQVQDSVLDKNKSALNETDSLDLGGDRESVRRRLDNAVTYYLMDQAVDVSAKQWAYGKMDVQFQEDPAAIAAMNHKYRLSEMATQFGYDKAKILMELAAQEEQASGRLPYGMGGALKGQGYTIQNPGLGNVTNQDIAAQNENNQLLATNTDMAISLTEQNASAILEYNNNLLVNGTDAEKAKAEQDILAVFNGEFTQTKTDVTTIKENETNPFQFLWGFAKSMIGSPRISFTGISPGYDWQRQLSASGTKDMILGSGIDYKTTENVVTGQKGLVQKQPDGTYKLVDFRQNTSLSEPGHADNYANLNDRLVSYANLNLVGTFANESSRVLKANIDANAAQVMEVKKAIDGVQNVVIENNKKIAGALGNEAGVDAWNASRYFTPDSARVKTKAEFVASFIDAYKNDEKYYPRTELGGYQRSQTFQISDEDRLENMTEDANEMYDKLSEAYNTLQRNPGATLGIELIASEALAGKGGLNRMFGTSTVYDFDGSFVGDDGFRLGADLYWNDFIRTTASQAFKAQNGVKIMYGTGYDITAANYDEAPDVNGAANAFNAFLSSAVSTDWSKAANQENRPHGRMSFHSVAANDANKLAVTIEPSMEWITSHTGTKENPGVAWELSKMMATGQVPAITYFIDEDKAQSSAFRQMKMSLPELIIATTGNYDLNAFSQFGGNMKFQKNPTGGYLGQGYMNYMTPDGKMGREQITEIIKPGQSLDFFVEKWQNAFQMNSQNVMQVKNSLNTISNKKVPLEALQQNNQGQ